MFSSLLLLAFFVTSFQTLIEVSEWERCWMNGKGSKLLWCWDKRTIKLKMLSYTPTSECGANRSSNNSIKSFSLIIVFFLSLIFPHHLLLYCLTVCRYRKIIWTKMLSPYFSSFSFSPPSYEWITIFHNNNYTMSFFVNEIQNWSKRIRHRCRIIFYVIVV